MSEKLIFSHAMRAMFRGNQARLSTGALERLAALGVDPRQRFEAAYPAATWVACLGVLAEDLHPGLEPAEGHRRVARATVEAYASELVGRTLFGLLRIVGAERMLKRMPLNFRSSSNFQETQVTRVSEVPWVEDITFSDVSGCPGFYLGLLEGGVAHLVRGERRVELRSIDGAAATYRVTRVDGRGPG